MQLVFPFLPLFALPSCHIHSFNAQLQSFWKQDSTAWELELRNSIRAIVQLTQQLYLRPAAIRWEALIVKAHLTAKEFIGVMLKSTLRLLGRLSIQSTQKDWRHLSPLSPKQLVQSPPLLLGLRTSEKDKAGEAVSSVQGKLQARDPIQSDKLFVPAAFSRHFGSQTKNIPETPGWEAALTKAFLQLQALVKRKKSAMLEVVQIVSLSKSNYHIIP